MYQTYNLLDTIEWLNCLSTNQNLKKNNQLSYSYKSIQEDGSFPL